MKLDSNKLIQLRAKRGWRQIDVAAKASVSLPTYVNAEQGKNIQAVKAAKIAMAFRVELDELEQKSA